jgi:D-arabinitol dehydrogenase (NADP+)
MRAVVYDRPHSLEVRSLPDPEPGPTDVVLRTLITGVCGTDLHLHKGGFAPAYPLTPGHEIVGEVIAIGQDVDTLEIGQQVAVDNANTCGHCAECRAGRAQHCPERTALGVDLPGGFADGLPLEAAVMIEPISCAVHGVESLNMSPGADVLVFGAGPSGNVLAQLLLHGGADRVTMAAPTAFKLDLARSHGIDETVLLDREDPEAGRRRLRELAPDGFDVVVDATGATSVLQHCVSLTRNTGTVFVYGMADEDAEMVVKPNEVFRRELSIVGSFAQAYGFERAVAVVKGGRVRTEGIVTHRFDLDEYESALDAVRSDPGCLKAAIVPG